MNKKKEQKHLCALDCKYASSCKWVLAKKKDKDPEKFPGLVVKRYTYRDNDRVMHGYRVNECPHYELDERSYLAKQNIAPQPKMSPHWTETELMKVAAMFGKHTYAEIGAKLGRPQGGIYRIVKMLKERGVI